MQEEIVISSSNEWELEAEVQKREQAGWACSGPRKVENIRFYRDPGGKEHRGFFSQKMVREVRWG